MRKANTRTKLEKNNYEFINLIITYDSEKCLSPQEVCRMSAWTLSVITSWLCVMFIPVILGVDLVAVHLTLAMVVKCITTFEAKIFFPC